MIGDLFQWCADLLAFAFDVVVLICRIWALWLGIVPLYVMIDLCLRACLLRGWLGERGDATLRAIEGDPGLLTAIRADQDGAVYQKAPAKELGSILILGDGPGARSLLEKRVATWRGGVIAIGPHGLSERVAVQDAVRFCPGERGSLRLNPMLMLQRDPFAWREARVLAAGLIGEDGYAAEILAAFMLDQLLTAPIEERHLAALRRRLFEPAGRDLQTRLHLKLGDKVLSHPEIARLGRRLAAPSEETAKAFAEIARALRAWVDGRIEEATIEIDVMLSDVVCGNVRSILIEAPPGDAAHCQYLFAALSGQAVLQLTDAAKTDNQGRIKKRPTLLVIEDAAFVPCIPLLRRRIRDLGNCGISIVIRAACLEDAAIALGIMPDAIATTLDGFDVIAAIGPQEAETAQALADNAGTLRLPHIVPLFKASGFWEYVGWLFPCPCWPKALRIQPKLLERLKPLQALLLRRSSKPKLRMLEFAPPIARTTWRAEPLPPMRHAWSAAPIPQPKTTMQRIREPVAVARTAQTELQLALGPEILPPEPFSPPTGPKRRPRKNR